LQAKKGVAAMVVDDARAKKGGVAGQVKTVRSWVFR